jgi:hypothetical protein
MSAALLEKLLNAGTPVALVAEVAAELARAQAAQELLEERRAKDRQRKRVPRNSTESTESAEFHDKGSLEVSPPEPPLPEPSKISPLSPPKIEEDRVDPEDVLEAWNVMAEDAGLPKAKMTPERRRKLNTFVKRHPVDDITEAIWAVPKSRFLCGENDRGWKANIDFFLQPSSFTKIQERSFA